MSQRSGTDLPPHRLQRTYEMHFSGYRCAVCERTWSVQPQSRCPGVKQYGWSSWPEGLYTKRQLYERHLRPGPLRGAIAYSRTCDGFIWLYRLDEATPAPARTEKQIAADKARSAGWRCVQCGGHLPYFIKGGGLCRHCAAHEAAAGWALEVLADQRTIILDTETTGLDIGSEILQIAVIDAQGNVLLGTLVHPEKPIDEAGGAFAVNGITNALVESAPRFPAMYARLAELVRDRLVIIYNRGYDLPIINWLAHQFGLPELEFADSACAMLMYAQYVGEWSDYHRGYRWQKLPGGDHSALGDCRATLAVLKKMASRGENEPTNP